jgi:hypothetical protein
MKKMALILVLAPVLVTAGCIMPVPTNEGGPYASREARQEALEERREALAERREALAHQRRHHQLMHQRLRRHGAAHHQEYDD